MQHANETALDKLWSSWGPSRSNGYANAAVWDASAEEFDKHPIPQWTDDAFLQLLDQEAPLSRNATVLDIGCGCGAYAIALADRVAQVTGVDISENMVRCAREKAARHGCSNLTFEQGDFGSLSFAGPYDIVIARLTPAIADGKTFKKMLELSKRYCAIAKPARRTDSVLDELRKIAGTEPQGTRIDDDFLKAISAVWLSGKNPTLRHYPDIWRSSYPLEKAFDLYGSRLIADDLGPKAQADIRTYLESIAVDGMVEESIVTTVMMLGWRM